MHHGLRPAIALAALAVAVAVAALIFAGCGSSAASSPKSRLIARADAICKPLNARRKAANAQVGTVISVSSLAKIAQIAPGLAAYERGVIAELGGLTVPSELSSDWQKILAGTKLLADNATKLGAYAKAKNLTEVESLIRQDQQSERELSNVATTAGFKNCGRNT